MKQINYSPAIQHYIELLKTYNTRTNIYSKLAYDKLDFHIQDCITLADIIGNRVTKVLDMGSGSGLPSLIIAICNPQNKVVAVESKQRKCDFLTWASTELNLSNYTVHCGNIFEYIHHTPSKPNIITAKAFAPYAKLKHIISQFKHLNAELIVPISSKQQALLEPIKIDENITFHCQDDLYIYLRKHYSY